MPRPPKPRCVSYTPEVTFFKPAGIPLRDLDEVVLGIDELEALRLKDLEGLDQEICAQRMNVAQSTLQRILTTARAKLTEAVVKGKAIRIEGGPVCIGASRFTCSACGREWDSAEPCTAIPDLKCPYCGSIRVRPMGSIECGKRGWGWRRGGRRREE